VANTFTVTASEAVAEDTVVKFQLQEGTAKLADFNAGSFNEVTATILKGETTATTSYTAITNDGTELSETYTVQATVGSTVLTKQATILDGSVGAGQTFTLTKEIDIIPGMKGSNDNTVTSGNDTVIGVINTTALSTDSTLTVVDQINTGEGVDTFKVTVVGNVALAALPTATAAEIVEVSSSNSAKVTADTSMWTGVTNLNFTKAAAAIAVKGAGTTDINVNMKAAGAAVDVDGGKAVNVTLTDVAGATDIVIVGANAQAKGAVTVSTTGAATTANAGGVTLSAAGVKGGTSITVTEKATSDASAAATDTSAGGTVITQGAVEVVGDASTTTVTVKQDAAVAKVQAVTAVALKAATQEVTFTEAKKGDTITLSFDDDKAGGTDDLKFTAKKDLTAAEVASAFANLATNANQGNASATLGLYTDAGGTNGWSSGAVQTVSATASKVVFSNSTDVTPTDGEDNTITASKTGTVTVPTVGAVVNGVAEAKAVTGVLGVVTGKVLIDDSGAGFIKTITVDGYATASRIGTGADTTLLETLTLKNAENTASMTVDDTAATLALTVEKLGYTNAGAAAVAVVTLTAAPTTLNVNSVGANTIDLTAAATETLNVSGTGLLDISTTDMAALKSVKVTETAGVTLNAGVNNTVTSVDTTGTTGTVTITIDGDKSTYAGGAGVDKVTVANPGTAVSKAMDLGGGDDVLTMTAATPLVPTVVIEGGAGNDTLVLAAADAASLSAAAGFDAKINGFERLEVGAVGADKTVTLSNLDAINYVITNGRTAASDLTLDKMLNGATVVLTALSAAGDDYIVKLTDTTGLTDTVNLITKAANGIDVGTVTVAGVETIAVTAMDTDTTTAVSTNTMTVDANKAATITVAGDGNLELVLSAATTEATSINASTMTGALTLATLAGDTAATTVKGGSGADVLTAAGANDVIEGGAGADTLKVTTGAAATLTGGADLDAFVVSGFNGAVGDAVTITDFAKGETIQFMSDAAADFNSAKVTLISESTFTEYVAAAMKVASVNASVAYGIAWFQFTSGSTTNTFIVQNKATDNAFNDGTDIIVRLTGAVDLTASSFNEVGQGTLLYI